jgi:cell division protein FtsB
VKTETPTRPAQRPGGRVASFGRRSLKLGLAFVTAVLLVNLLTGSRGLPAVLQARREFEREGQALDRIRSANGADRAQIKRLLQDAEAVEEVARRELNYVAPGEMLFIIHDAAPPDAPQSAPAPPTAPARPSR